MRCCVMWLELWPCAVPAYVTGSDVHYEKIKIKGLMFAGWRGRL